MIRPLLARCARYLKPFTCRRNQTTALVLVVAAAVLSACGGGGGSSSSSTTTSTTTTTTALSNFATVTVDGGPAALDEGPNGYLSDNVAFVSVTLCAPGSTTNCQTIDHVEVDTGSVGLRILQSALSSTLLAALPLQTDSNSNPVGECYGFVDGYVFGSVRSADFTVGGESVSSMPLQVVGDTGVFSTVPSTCSAGGGSDLNTLQAFGANGIIGIGTTATDCASYCTIAGGYSAAIYYDCPSSGCSSLIAEAASTTAPFQQLPNPVAAMAVDNNGTILTLPAAPAAGEASMTGTLYFGIGTETNNALGSATVLTVTTSSNSNGAGLLTTTFDGATLDESFLDSGTNLYIFVDNSVAACTNSNFTGYYCPSSPIALSPTIVGLNNATASGAFTLNNAQTLLSTTNSVLPGVGGNPDLFSNSDDYPNSFDFGLPFFYGKSVYTAIEGRSAGGTTGPYFAF